MNPVTQEILRLADRKGNGTLAEKLIQAAKEKEEKK